MRQQQQSEAEEVVNHIEGVDSIEVEDPIDVYRRLAARSCI